MRAVSQALLQQHEEGSDEVAALQKHLSELEGELKEASREREELISKLSEASRRRRHAPRGRTTQTVSHIALMGYPV